MDDRKEVLLSDLRQAFGPKENLSEIGVKGKWRTVEYTATEFSGVMLSAMHDAHPADISCRPGLKGYYKIYLLMYTTAADSEAVFIKLKNDVSFEMVCPNLYCWWKPSMEQFFWRCADMTGEEITLSCRKVTKQNCILNAIRFVPMTEEEVAAYKAEQKRTDTRTVYGTNDMHNLACVTQIENISDWLETILPARDSDLEYMSFEETRNFFSGRCPVDPDDFAFSRWEDLNVEKQFFKFDYDKVLKLVCDKTREMGIKPVISFRMGAWGGVYPYDQFYFDCAFAQENKQWRCIDRDGTMTEKMSYAYKGVRDRIIGFIVNAARAGCDAVSLISYRGPAYVLYEEPVRKRFQELYGEDPCVYALDEPRLNKLHCGIMTGFFRELREALDKEFGTHKVKIHLRALFSPDVSKYCGFDCEELVREELVDLIVSYPNRYYETLDDSIWTDETKTKIDLDKFRASVQADTSQVIHDTDLDFAPPFKSSRGEPVGPKTQAERIAEWQKLEEKYGVPVYYDVLPRIMEIPEYKRRIDELYRLGAKRLSFWDTYSRMWNRPMWNAIRSAGHKDDLMKESFFEQGTATIPILSLNKVKITRYNPMWGG